MAELSYKEIVQAQLDHQETPVVPYTLDIEPPVAARLTEYYGTEAWSHSIEPYIYMAGCFDSWNTMRRYGDQKAVDAYGTEWTLTEDIAHVDVPVLERVPYEQYVYPSVSCFSPPKKKKFCVGPLKSIKILTGSATSERDPMSFPGGFWEWKTR